VVIIGNDYLLTFDKKNKLIEKKRLHKNIIPIDYAKAKEEEVVTMHSHLPETGDFITATDVCTLMLYEKFAKWKQHLVISNDYVNIWDCKNNSLSILTKTAWENIYKDQKKTDMRNNRLVKKCLFYLTYKLFNNYKLLIFISITFLTTSSCDVKDGSTKNGRNISKYNDEFHQMRSESNKLLIKRYDLGPDSNRIADLNNVVWKGLFTNAAKLEKFNTLFSEVKNTGYLCCPKTHYTIAFYKENTQLGLYSVDTTEYKDNVILFGPSFQTTYVIKLKDFQSIIHDK
jgi:hypothetical protein